MFICVTGFCSVLVLARLVSHGWGVVWSANLQISVFFKMKNRSFKNMLNKIGLRTNSRPSSNADHKLKLVLILCSLPANTEVTVLFIKNSYQRHMHLILLIVTSWLIVWNALCRSMSLPPDYPFLSSDAFHFSNIHRNGAKVFSMHSSLWFFQNQWNTSK